MLKESSITNAFIVRHALREDKIDRNWYVKPQRSYDDPPLASKGREQANELAERLANEHIDHIFSSPFERCVETASIISNKRHNPLPIKLENGICELLCWGFPPGFRTKEDTKPLFPLVHLEYESVFELEDWEPTNELCHERAATTWKRLESELSGSVLFVSHGAPITGLLHHLTGQWGQVGVANLSQLRPVGEGWLVELDGSVEHLSA